MTLPRFILIFFFATLLSSCSKPPGPGIGNAVEWSQLEGWQMDRHAESWTSLLRGCSKLKDRPEWAAACHTADGMPSPTDEEAREFYEQWFTAHGVYAENGNRTGLITGYYEPLLFGSLEQTEQFRYPIYQRPEDLLSVELSGLYPELKGKRVRGRLSGNKIIPYHSRESLESSPKVLQGQELVWVDDPVALFFLHVQGSGRIVLRDGSVLGVGYADQNGHPYRSIGRELIAMGELNKDDVNLFSIRKWLDNNPTRINNLFERNPSYVFFTERPAPEEGPYGSLNVPLVAERTIAVDPGVIPLGSPVWLDTTLPGSGENYRRLVLAQDTGGAIKGHVRADVFWGQGQKAERMAGLMKQDGQLYVLRPVRQESREIKSP